MAFYNQSEKMYNNGFDTSKNKVYINPNFNRLPVSNLPNSAVMHVNPRFPYFASNVQANPTNARIHVNPNFMKSKSDRDDTEQMPITNVNYMQQQAVSSSNFYSNSLGSSGPSAIETRKQIVPTSITKSRYSFVRQNPTVIAKPLEIPILEKPKTTFQINKYKSIPLNDIKRNLDNAKNTSNKHPNVISRKETDCNVITNRKYLNSSSTSIPNASRNQFKLVNHNIGAVGRNNKIKSRTSIIHSNKKISNQSRLTKAKELLKKNNIPCPTFRKFGKCLRKMRGNCEFLHDKKHVSICRKFVKGLCHDKNCLLSHDLTTKKMPTCYFYLQGTCTKQNCPYLHVKLNEKVKICPDFLKGYCEKGSKCLLRHIHTERKVKDSVKFKSSPASKRKFRKNKNKNCDVQTTQIKENSALTEKNESHTDCRYYQENKVDKNATETCEMIKPMRCKLGTLPSFIQL